MHAQVFTKKSGRQLGEVEFTPQAFTLTLQANEAPIRLPWEEVEIKIGGAGNKLVFFNPTSAHSEFDSFYIERNKDNLSILKQLGHPQLDQLFGQDQKETLKARFSLVSVLTLTAVFLASLYFYSGSVLGFLSSFVPYSIEKQLGEKLLGVMLPPADQINDPDILEILRAEVGKLLPALPKEMQDVGIYISNKSEVNAFALPGGHIVFNLGMLKKASNIEEILGVAAHELAHVRQRHVLRGMIQSVGVYFLVDLFLGDVTGLIAVITSNSDILLRLGFSRSQEKDADHVGFDMLTEVGIDPKGMIDFFRMMMAEQEKLKESDLGKLQSQLSFLSTHPETESRIKIISERREKVLNKKNFTKIDFDYPAFKQSLKDL